MKTLEAWIAGRPVGELILKDNGNLQFRYGADYEGPPISQSLPVQKAAHPHQAARAVFGGLLPEADVRKALAARLGLSEGNDYGLLDAVGGDVAGAVALLPPGTVPAAEPTWQQLDATELSRLLDALPERPLATDPEHGIRLSLAGAQPKLPVTIGEDEAMSLPTNAVAATTHILKPEPPRFPGLVDNEAFCMALARECGLATARVAKGVTSSGTPYLIVERYDRRRDGERILRVHQEDFCQALGVPAERKYQEEGGPTVVQCAELIRRCAAVPAQELPRFASAVAFNWIIGNCDAHGKNYSLVYDGRTTTLAPLYDLVATVLYPELTTRLAMSIGPARMIDDADDRAWATLAAGAGYRAEFFTSIVEKLLGEAAAHAKEMTAAGEHDNDMARAIAARILALAKLESPIDQ